MLNINDEIKNYHEGYETALIELKKLQQKYNEKLCNSLDFSEGFFDAINDYSGDE